jgi:type II restriction enzyme
MNVLMDVALAEGYSSPSQKARRITEGWFESNMYCPSCVNERFEAARGSNPVVDFVCAGCGAEFQVKSKSGPLGRKLRDAAYGPMMQSVKDARAPHFAFLHYSSLDWSVVNLLLVPGHFITLESIEKCAPLSSQARRAGWIGCNILTETIPPDGRLLVVKDGLVVPKEDVRRGWQRYEWIGKQKVENRGWTSDVLRCVRILGKREFTLADVYRFTGELAKSHPYNKHIEDKIRQQLQVLRDHGIIEFLGRGHYTAV